MRLQRSMLCPASNRTRQCQEKAAVPRGCQCALERLSYFLKGQQDSCKKRKTRSNTQKHFSHFPFSNKKKCYSCPHSILFTRLTRPALLLLCTYSLWPHVKSKLTVGFTHVTKLALLSSLLSFAFIWSPEEIINRMYPAGLGRQNLEGQPEVPSWLQVE